MKYFKTIDGKTVNAVEHTLEQIDKYPNLKIHIGTDSQSYGGGRRKSKTVYVTTIIFRYGNRGCHYIYLKEEITPKIKSEYMRLYDEGVRTISTYERLTSEIPVAVEALEFDYQEVDDTISKKLVSTFRGWVFSLNVKASFKSSQMIATKAADHIIRH